MLEKEPTKSTREGVDPLNHTSKPLDESDALTQKIPFFDQLLMFHGAALTDANRQDLRSKIESIQKHLN